MSDNVDKLLAVIADSFSMDLRSRRLLAGKIMASGLVQWTNPDKPYRVRALPDEQELALVRGIHEALRSNDPDNTPRMVTEDGRITGYGEIVRDAIADVLREG